MNGKAAALMPRSRMNSRRLLRWAMSLLRSRVAKTDGQQNNQSRQDFVRRQRLTAILLVYGVDLWPCQSGRRHDLDHQLPDVEIVGGEESSQVGQLLGPEGTDRLLDQIMEQLLDEGGVRLFAGGQERREVWTPSNLTVSPARVS